jgi:hypothetical protein
VADLAEPAPTEEVLLTGAHLDDVPVPSGRRFRRHKG